MEAVRRCGIGIGEVRNRYRIDVEVVRNSYWRAKAAVKIRL